MYGKNITGNATTIVNKGDCTLDRVTVNTVGVASTTAIYDGVAATGTLLATIDSDARAGTFEYGIHCLTGICVVTTGAPNITVVYH